MASAAVPTLPTFNNLGISPPKNIDPVKIAREWLEKFQTSLSPSLDGDIDVDKVLDLFRPDAFWRDILSLTWDFRTFFGISQIRTFLQDRISNPGSIGDKARLKNLKLESAGVGKPDEDITWIEALFTFSIGTWGAGDGVFRLVLSPEGVWKGFTIYTNLQSLSDYPEKVGTPRDPEVSTHGKIEFEGTEPYVLIAGGGQSGLALGARLKYLGIPTLIVEKYPRVGDQWWNRYEALCLHDPVCKSSCSFGEYSMFERHSLQGTTTCLTSRKHGAIASRNSTLTFLRFPPTWPMWTPAHMVCGTTSVWQTLHQFALNSWRIGSSPMPRSWTSTSGPPRPSRPLKRVPREGGSSSWPEYSRMEQRSNGFSVQPTLYLPPDADLGC